MEIEKGNKYVTAFPSSVIRIQTSHIYCVVLQMCTRLDTALLCDAVYTVDITVIFMIIIITIFLEML